MLRRLRPYPRRIMKRLHFELSQSLQQGPYQFTEQQAHRFVSKIACGGTDECWLWTRAKTKAGYGSLTSGGKRFLAHRVSAGIIGHAHALHKCDNRSCVNPRHISRGSNSDNVADKVGKGRQMKGEECPSSKVTSADVRMMRYLRDRGESLKTLARAFGVSQSQVCAICTRKEWRHVA